MMPEVLAAKLAHETHQKQAQNPQKAHHPDKKVLAEEPEEVKRRLPQIKQGLQLNNSGI